jgi:hypothetical protein
VRSKTQKRFLTDTSEFIGMKTPTAIQSKNSMKENEEYGSIRASLGRAGNMISPNDSLFAAVALVKR